MGVATFVEGVEQKQKAKVTIITLAWHFLPLHNLLHSSDLQLGQAAVETKYHCKARVADILLPESRLLLLAHCSEDVPRTQVFLVGAVEEVECQVVLDTMLLGVDVEETHSIKCGFQVGSG